MSEFIQQLINGIALGSIYGLIAVGYTIVYGILGLINFAHGEIYMFGTFSAYMAVQFAKGHGHELGFVPALVIGMAGAAVLGVTIERIAYRPLRAASDVPARLLGVVLGAAAFLLTSAILEHASVHLESPFAPLGRLFSGGPPAAVEGGGVHVSGWFSLALWAAFGFGIYRVSRETLARRKMLKAGTLTALLTALGVSLLLQNLGIQVFGATPRSFPQLVEFHPYEYRGVILANQDALIFGVMLVSMIVLQLVIYKTRIGKAMRAVAVDQDAARLMGVELDFTISFAFAVGSSLAAIAGVLYAIRYAEINPLMGALPGAKAFVAAVLGGIGDIPGAVVGGLIMGVTETMVVGYISSTLRDAFAFGILILILLVKPTGLMGSSQPEKV